MSAERLKQGWRRFWEERAARERRMIQIAAGVVALTVLYGGIYAPLAERRATLERRLPELRAQHRLAEAQVAEIERLRQRDGTDEAAALPLARRVESRAMARDLATHLVSISPLGEARVQVIAEGRPPADWIHWLIDLRGQGIALESLTLNLDEKTGHTRLRAVLAQRSGE